MPTISFNTQFPGYEVIGEIGRSNARILKVRQQATGKLFALKHFALNTDAETLHRFQREAEIMTRVSHPNVVCIEEVQLEAELPYLVMDFVEGGDLRGLLLQRHRLDIGTTVGLTRQLVSALEALQALGIIHRDLKPENVLLRYRPDGSLHAMLTDFGIASARIASEPTDDSRTKTGLSLMTLEYASPEQFDDPRHVTAATDYYSLGVMLYESLTGYVPFPKTDAVGMASFMNRVLTNVPPPLVLTPDLNVPISLSSLIDKLLAKKPADRLQDTAQIARLLDDAERTQTTLGIAARTRPAPAYQPHTQTQAAPVMALPPNVPEPAHVPETVYEDDPNAGRSGWGTAAIVAAVVLLLGGGGWFIWQDRFANRTPATMTSQSIADSASTMLTDTATAVLDTAEIARLQREEAEQLETERQEILELATQVTVEIADWKADKLLGGISDVTLRLNNPTRLTFRRVTVRVSYIKAAGGLYKVEEVNFYNVGPNSAPTLPAPDSERGTEIRAEIVDAESPEIDAVKLNSSASITAVEAVVDSTSDGN
jgi:eukaryotic-like serine/threonine-protein kinase